MAHAQCISSPRIYALPLTPERIALWLLFLNALVTTKPLQQHSCRKEELFFCCPVIVVFSHFQTLEVGELSLCKVMWNKNCVLLYELKKNTAISTTCQRNGYTAVNSNGPSHFASSGSWWCFAKFFISRLAASHRQLCSHSLTVTRPWRIVSSQRKVRQIPLKKRSPVCVCVRLYVCVLFRYEQASFFLSFDL